MKVQGDSLEGLTEGKKIFSPASSKSPNLPSGNCFDTIGGGEIELGSKCIIQKKCHSLACFSNSYLRAQS